MVTKEKDNYHAGILATENSHRHYAIWIKHAGLRFDDVWPQQNNLHGQHAFRPKQKRIAIRSYISTS